MAENGLHALHDGAGEPLVIERRGLSVVLARNFPGDVVKVLVDAAFAGSSAPPLGSRPPLHVRVGVEDVGGPVVHTAASANSPAARARIRQRL